MKITLNGEEKELPTDSGGRLSVSELVAYLGMTGKPLAVELNKVVIRFREHSETYLNEGDIVEVVALVGGG